MRCLARPRVAGAMLVALLVAGGTSAPAIATAPLYDASALNIGLNCQWQRSCIRAHSAAKKRSLKYVEKYSPPTWRVQLCNRNARRGTLRIDWVGFDHCIRNAELRQPPPPPPPPRPAAPPHRKKRVQRR